MNGAFFAPAVFLFVVGGLGLPWAHRLAKSPEGRFAATWLLGIVVAGLLGQACHLASLPPAGWRLPALAGAGLGWILCRREASGWFREPETFLLLRQTVVVGTGSLAALAVVRTYSGGDWIGDWVGHFHRALYFLAPAATPEWVLALDPFTARPPLVNLATALLLATGVANFASYQVFTTLIGVAAVPPLLRLARQFGASPAAASLLPCALLLHPLFLENITYSWTKLACAAFVIAGVDAWLRHRRGRESLGPALFWLSAATLAHYSAAPYVLVLGGLHLWMERRKLSRANWWADTLRAAWPALFLAATWIFWAAHSIGWGAALGSHTTTLKQFHELAPHARAAAFCNNLLRTLLPPPWLDIDRRFLAHGSTPATLRDYAFSVYQTCLPGMIGLGGLVALVAGWRGHLRRTPDLGAALCAVAALVVIGVAVHPAPMRWGAGHICLQPLALILLALAVAQWPRLAPRWRAWVVALTLMDAALGVCLHFTLQSLVFPLDQLAQIGVDALRAHYGLALANNALAKVALELTLLGDLVGSAWLPALAWLLCVLLSAHGARQRPALPHPLES